MHRTWIAAALVAGVALVGRLSAQTVVFSEVMYEPPGGSAVAEAEFLELLNPGRVSVDLSGASFASGLTFTFPTPYLLPPGARAVICRNRALF